MVDVPTSKYDEAAALDGGELLLLSQPSASVTITATTISAQASDNSFNDSATGFVTAGFAVSDYVRIAGFTGNAANNIVSAKITALTAGKMTIGGADGDVIVDDAAGESVTITKWTSKRAAAQDIADLAPPPSNPTESIIVACSDEATAITTGTAKVTFRMPYAFTLTEVRASVTTAPTGSTIIIDINEAGSTILSTKLSIDASEKTSFTAASAAVISDTALANDAEITIDFDQVGSTIAGAGVKVYLIGVRA
jgi:hypothetical protein